MRMVLSNGDSITVDDGPLTFHEDGTASFYSDGEPVCMEVYRVEALFDGEDDCIVIREGAVLRFV